MKRYILCSLSLFLTVLQLHADPLLVAVLMVKNEASVMERTLQPLVDAGIKDFLIYDTGSTDNTIEVTRQFFIKNNIANFVIVQGDWVDFSVSRNKALELTEQHFPDATFMLMIDAEWILHNGEDLLKFCQKYQYDGQNIYAVKVQGAHLAVNYARLIRCKSDIKFVGKIHEHINVAAQITLPLHIYFEWNATHAGREKSNVRWLHDLDILLDEVQKDPTNARAVFYLAQTYFCLNDLQNAAQWYECRADLVGYDEETFLAVYNLGIVYALLGDEEQMIFNYLKAFAIRPIRAEPLIRLALYYFAMQSYDLAYVFARYACTIPYPIDENALIERQLYEFSRYNVLSAVAYYAQDFRLGLQATLKALKAQPNFEYLYDNLRQYQEALSCQH